MNLKWLDSSGGRVFAAVKTSFSSAAQPLIQLLSMDPTGAWTKTTIATVSECPNRVILLIDEAAQRLRTFATYPKPSGTTNAGVCTTSGGAIYEKSTPLDNISFTTDKTAADRRRRPAGPQRVLDEAEPQQLAHGWREHHEQRAHAHRRRGPDVDVLVPLRERG